MNNVLSAAACDDFHCSMLSSLWSVLLKCPYRHSNYFIFSDISPETEMVVAVFFPSHEKCMLIIWAWQKGLPLLCMGFFFSLNIICLAQHLAMSKLPHYSHQHRSESFCSTHSFTCPQLVVLNSLKTQSPFSKSWLILRAGASLKNTLFFPGALALVLSHYWKALAYLFGSVAILSRAIPFSVLLVLQTSLFHLDTKRKACFHFQVKLWLSYSKAFFGREKKKKNKILISGN